MPCEWHKPKGSRRRKGIFPVADGKSLGVANGKASHQQPAMPLFLSFFTPLFLVVCVANI